MSLPATDNFNRSDGPLGANWTQGPGAALAIVSEYARASAGWADCSMYWSADTPSAGQYAQCVELLMVGGNGPGPTVRHSATDFVVLCADTDWHIEWYNGGSFTQIGSTYATTPLANDIAKITANGSTFKGYVNGTERISGSNASAPSSGNGGLYSMTNSDSIDNFEVGNLPASASVLLDRRFLRGFELGIMRGVL